MHMVELVVDIDTMSRDNDNVYSMMVNITHIMMVVDADDALTYPLV